MDKGAVQTPIDRTLVRLHLTVKLRNMHALGTPEWIGYQRRLDWLLDEYLRLLRGQ